MKKYVYLSLITLAALTSCKEGFKKGDNGLEYKIISNGKGQQLKPLNFMQLQITEMYKGSKDTILSDTRETMPRVIGFDSVSTPLAYYKILAQMRKGDSVVVRALTDSLFKSMPERMPPFMAKGKYVYTSVKLLNIFTTVKEADSARDAEAIIAKPRIRKLQLDAVNKELAKEAPQLAADSKIIEDYLAKNNIRATKTKWGVYVAVHNEGTGNKATLDDVITVNYTGKTLDSGKVFDSNIDPAFQHVQPYPVPLGQIGSVIPGWTDGLQELRKGSKATFYIPSSLAYGKSGNQGIRPGAILVFDVEALNVENEDAAMKRIVAEQLAAQQKMMESAKKDSAGKVTPAQR